MRALSVPCGFLVAFLLIPTVTAGAADAPNPQGDWRFTVAIPVAPERTMTYDVLLTLKYDGEKVTGMIGPKDGSSTSAIQPGTFKDEVIEFTAFNTAGIEMRFKGKLADDTIDGKCEFELGGPKPAVADWKAKRERK